ADEHLGRRAEALHERVGVAGLGDARADILELDGAFEPELGEHAAGELEAPVEPARDDRDERDHDEQHRKPYGGLPMRHEIEARSALKQLHWAPCRRWADAAAAGVGRRGG